MAEAHMQDTGFRTLAPPRGLPRQSARIWLYLILFVSDLTSLVIGFSVATQVRGIQWLSPGGTNMLWFVAPIYLMFAFNRDSYTIDCLRKLSESVRRSMAALFATTLVVLMFSFFAQAGESISRLAFGSAVVSSALVLLVGRYLIHRLSWWQFNGVLTDELLIVDGVDAPSHGAAQIVDAGRVGLKPDLQDPQMLARLAMLVHHFDRVVVACPIDRQVAWSTLLKGADVVGEIVIANGNGIGAVGIDKFNDTDTMVVSRGPLSYINRAKKRALDVGLTVPALMVLAVPMLIVAILIRLESSGPIFFRQQRVGQGNRLFEILKFRSMRVETLDHSGNRSASRDDDRVTRVGRFIRRTSIDELPQLINVLRGDMSLVGPRPHALGSRAGDKLFWQVNEQYWLRHALKPGITGLAQIRGFRGATHEQEDLEHRLQADLEYVNGWRLWHDIVILFQTVNVLTHKNAY